MKRSATEPSSEPAPVEIPTLPAAVEIPPLPGGGAWDWNGTEWVEKKDPTPAAEVPPPSTTEE